MVAAFDYCLHGRGGAAPSIDTAMHGLVDAAHVDHLHPDSGIALATAADGEALTRRCFGDRVAWVDWRRPGLPARPRHRRDPAGAPRGDRGDPRRPRHHRLGRHVGRVRGALARDHPDRRAVHRRATAGRSRSGRRSPATSRCPRPSATPGRPRCCRSSAAWPRPTGRRSATTPTARSCSTSSAGPSIRGWPRSARRAPTTSCGPRSGRWSSTCRRRAELDDVVARLRELHAAYRADYAAYYERHATPDSPPMRGADPAIVLVPGVGMFSFGANKQTARVAGEFYVNAINVMRGAEALSTLRARSPSRRSSGSSTGRSRRPSSRGCPSRSRSPPGSRS